VRDALLVATGEMHGFQQHEYEQYDTLGLAERVRHRQVTSEALLEVAIARVEVRNGTINAVVRLIRQTPGKASGKKAMPSRCRR
jgi:hypothetical protein